MNLTEGTAGVTTFVFSVTVDAEIDVDIPLNFTTTNGTATVADNDYTATSGSTLILAANTGGSQVQTISVDVIGDTKVELNQDFRVNLSGFANAGRNITLIDAEGVGTIVNDDLANLSIDDVTLNEGDLGDTFFTFTVTLDAEVDTDVSVNYNTVNSTASATRGDFMANNGNSFLFPANAGGPQSQTFNVDVKGDEKVELDEAFFTSLSRLVATGRNVVISDSRGCRHDHQ